MPKAEFYECPDCGEKVYDREAMLKIEAHSPAFRGKKKQQLKLELLAKLSVAQKQQAEGDKGKTLKEAMANIRKSIDAKR